MKPRGLIVLELVEGVTIGEIADLAELLKQHKIVASSRLVIAEGPGVAKARELPAHGEGFAPRRMYSARTAKRGAR